MTDKRHREGRRSALPFLFLAILLGAALGPWIAPAGAGSRGLAALVDSLEELGLPPDLPRLSTGDLLFSADACAFPDRSDSLPLVEFYVRIANEQLHFHGGSENRLSHVQLSLTVSTPAGQAVLRSSRFVGLAADSVGSTSVAIRQVLQWHERLDPGVYRVRVEMTDLDAPKKTLIGMIKKQNRNGVAEGMMRVPAYSGDSLEISDLEFAEAFLPADSSIFRKQHVTVYPNPGRRYGQSDSEVKVYFSGHLPAGQGAAAYRTIWEVLSNHGDRLMLMADSLYAGPVFERAQSLRLQALPAGHYRLRLSLVQGDAPPRRVEAGFDMAWSPASALDRTVVALADLGRLVFEDEDLDKFEEMSPGEQESYWNDYWTKLALNSTDPESDPRAEFEARVAYANSNFGGLQTGVLTDRGRCYVRYGPPDDVTQRVMPVGGESLTDLGDQLTLDGDAGQSDMIVKHGGNAAGDTRSYEIWDYDLRSRMLFGTRARQGRHGSQMRFIFADETGVGDYVLKYSSE